MCITLMKILKKLEDNNAKVVYVKDYSRIHLPIKDTFDMFKADGNVHISTLHLIGNNANANVSIQNRIEGKVSIHPMDAKEAGLENEVKAVKFLTQSIIKDGKLNVDTLTVLVDENTAKTLNKVKGLVVESAPAKHGGMKMKLDLTAVPVAETKLSDLDLLHIAQKVNNLTIDKKIIEYILPKEEDVKYDEKQIECLNKYGIKNGVYMGINNQVNPENKEVNTYECKEVKFTIKGAASIPSIKSIVTGKEPTRGLKKEIYDRYNELKTMPIDMLKNYLEGIVKELKYLKLRLMNARIVKVNTNAQSAEITDGVTIMNIDIKTVTKEYA